MKALLTSTSSKTGYSPLPYIFMDYNLLYYEYSVDSCLQSLDGSLDKIFAGVISCLALAISDLDAGPSRRLTAIMLRQFTFEATEAAEGRNFKLEVNFFNYI